MTIIPFGLWRPDLAPLDSGSVNALNVLRTTDGWEVMPSPTPLGIGSCPAGVFWGRSPARGSPPTGGCS
jgi:hypothetical protein